MTHQKPSESMPVVAAGGMAVLRNMGHRTARAGVTRAVQAWRGVQAFVHKRISGVGTWFIDHHNAVIIGSLILASSAVAILLNYRMEEVIEYARFAPVLGALLGLVTAVFKTLKWFRKRARARLVARRAGIHGGRPPARHGVQLRRRPGRASGGRRSRPGKPGWHRGRRARSAGTRPRASRPLG